MTLRRPLALGGAFDFQLDPSTIPTTPGGGIDWGAALMPPAGSSAAGKSTDVQAITRDIVRGAEDFYGAQTRINTAKYDAARAKAESQAAVNVARAGGVADVQRAGSGLPSSALLLAAGLGLAALMLIRR